MHEISLAERIDFPRGRPTDSSARHLEIPGDRARAHLPINGSDLRDDRLRDSLDRINAD